MSDPGERPDPDALLRRVQEEEARAKRGKLKIFFGFASGVGKTYRMLQEARDLGKDLDVVVGVVEAHRRVETARLVHGLEVLPRREVAYRGHTIDDFDLDAALERRPALLLVDELAHTNAAGSRHPKRWQDVEELLDAGIDVFTTLNVQHVESLQDAVAQITHIQVRETVPDSIFDQADAIELVDIAPEELLDRLKEGKVYLPDQAKLAATHFFQLGNLLALRELALRRTAQQIDEEVQEYREEHGVAVPWPAGERILVCVDPAPNSGRLIRAAARMAETLHCPWVVSYVESISANQMGENDLLQLEAHFRVAEALGATVTRLSGASVSSAILEYARKHNVTRLMIGKPMHSRFWDFLHGSLLDEVVRGSGEIDVHVISGDPSYETPPRDNAAPGEHATGWNYVSATLLVTGTLGLALVLRALLDLPDLEMLFLLAVMVAAVWFGRGPSILAAALGVACHDFFFVPPVHTFAAVNRRYFLTFGMMFAVSFALSELAGRLRRLQRDSQAREERTAALYALTRELSSSNEPTEIAAIAARHAADIFSAKAIVLGVSADGELIALGASPNGAELDRKDWSVAKWSHEHDTLAGFGTNTLPGADALCAPLRVGHSRLGVIALVLHDKTELSVDRRGILDVLCRQVAVALERERLVEAAKGR